MSQVRLFHANTHRPSSQRELKVHRLDGTNGHLGRACGLLDGALDRYGVRLDRINRRYIDDHAVRSLELRTDFFGIDEVVTALSIGEGLAAAAVAFHGRGNLADFPTSERKERESRAKMEVDRAAASVHAFTNLELLRKVAGVHFVTAMAEGGRWKPGEAGSNPGSFLGQRIGDTRQIPISVVRDDVDGTGKATRGNHSSFTSSLYTSSGVQRTLEDRYLFKIVSGQGFSEGSVVTPEDSYEAIVRALAGANGVPLKDLNLFALVRPRHDAGNRIATGLGANVIQDKDGDLIPGLSVSLRLYQYPHNDRPLHGMAQSGGAAEAGMLLPTIWRGGSVQLAYAGSDGVPEAGPSLAMSDIYRDPLAPGASFFGGITNNHHVPHLLGAQIKDDAMRVFVLGMSADGRAWVDSMVFRYTYNRKVTDYRLLPLVGKARLVNSDATADQVIAEAFEVDALAAMREVETDFYGVLEGEPGRWTVNEDAVRALSTPPKPGKPSRYDPRDIAILRSVQRHGERFFGPEDPGSPLFS